MKIEISDALFKRLQEQAVPFVDTPESVIMRALDALQFGTAEVTKTGKLRRFRGIKEIPSVRHTRIIRAEFGCRVVTDNWASLLRETLIYSSRLLGEINQLFEITTLNIVAGIGIKEKGFEYIPEIGCSFQRCDADQTLRHLAGLCDELDLIMKINFEWRQDDKATYPGEKGEIELGPLSQGVK